MAHSDARPRSRRGRLVRVIAAVFGVSLLTAPVGNAAADNESEAHVVRAVGGPDMRPNEHFINTMRFDPGEELVTQGERITWKEATVPPHPHSVTIVEESQLPQTFEEMVACSAPGGACAAARAAHRFPGASLVPVVDKGQPGLDVPGDSLFQAPGADISAIVSAPPGQTLHYVCMLHPWMQGEIRVS